MSRRKAKRQLRYPRVTVRSCVVVTEPAHAEKQHAREPGDLRCRLRHFAKAGPREGLRPNGGHARAGEVGLAAVVPVNQPNKAAIAAAEAEEGRAQMKENIDQSRMLPTQSGNRMSQGLDGVRKAATERKQERFTSLLPPRDNIAVAR